jgi:DNA-binding CsgD family transcriptional regulator
VSSLSSRDIDDLRDWASGMAMPGLNIHALVRRLCDVVESTGGNPQPSDTPLPEALEVSIRLYALQKRFTARQSALFLELFRGDTSVKTLAQRLGIKENTVNNHLKELFRRTDTHSRADLLAAFVRASFEQSIESR